MVDAKKAEKAKQYALMEMSGADTNDTISERRDLTNKEDFGVVVESPQPLFYLTPDYEQQV